MKIVHMSLICIFIWISCNLKPQNNLEQSPKFSDSNTTTHPDQKSNKQYDTISEPIEEKSFPAKILTTGFFHKDEISKTIFKENWFGLFKNKTGYYLSTTKIKVKRIHDEMIDEEETDKTGWNIQTSNKDTSIILIGGLHYLSNRKVEEKVLPKYEIFPGDSINFNYLGIEYTLNATGNIQKNTAADKIWDYQLYLNAVKDGRIISDLLFEKRDTHYKMITILFSGDVDNLIDFIIDTSTHESATILTLYLSKPADNDKLLKIEGQQIGVGC